MFAPQVTPGAAMTDSQNPKEQPLSQEDVQEFLDAGREADFLLEIEALRLLDEMSYRLDFCGRYDDAASHKTREFDLQAWQTGNDGRTVVLAVECKNISENSPILALCSPTTNRERYIAFIERKKPTEGLNHLSSPFKVKRCEWPPYIENEYDCRTIEQIARQVKGNQGPKIVAAGNQVYSKWEQATASLGALIRQAAEDALPIENECYFFPILVVPDETLWSVCYDLKGKRTVPPGKVDFVLQSISLRCEFGSKPPHESLHISKMHVTTLTGFRKFLVEAAFRFGLKLAHNPR
jgi:hypothetical protein